MSTPFIFLKMDYTYFIISTHIDFVNCGVEQLGWDPNSACTILGPQLLISSIYFHF